MLKTLYFHLTVNITTYHDMYALVVMNNVVVRVHEQKQYQLTMCYGVDIQYRSSKSSVTEDRFFLLNACMDVMME